MAKQLINVIGIVVAVGIVLIAFVTGVVPQLSAAAGTNARADQVASTNAAYQARINQLKRQEANLPSIKATVAKLHRQIPAEYQLDDVFLLVAKAAAASGGTISGVTAGEPAAFTERTAPAPAGQPTPAPGATPQPTATASASPAPTTGSNGRSGAAGAAAGEGRTQIEITIQVTVPDNASASKFLDGLRSGPRLLANVTSTATTGSGSIDLQVTGLAFAAPSTVVVAAGGN